jgi:hypothetical protein
MRPAKFVNIMINGNLYYSKIKADLGQYLVNKEQFSWDIRVSPNFTIAKNIRIQATGVYRSGNLRLQGSSQAVYFINLFARADFFKRKLSVNIGIQDIFNWQDQKSRTNTPTLTGNSEYKYVTRYISAGITVRLGKIELENKVKTGNEGVN